MLMISLRAGERALSLAWRLKKTQGAIGFDVQRQALEAVVAQLPDNARVMLMGDRYCGSPALIEWCHAKGWGWRLRCKQDLLVFEQGGEMTLAEYLACGQHMLSAIELTGKRARTNKPWIIAMSDPPSVWSVLDYGLRWGIGTMFSDYQTRGFNLEGTARSSEPTATTASCWCSASRTTGRSPQACGMRRKTRRPPKKTTRPLTQERRSQPDIPVQMGNAQAAVLSPTPHPPTASLVRLENLMGGELRRLASLPAG